MDKIRVRYAPSPTGFNHSGGIRTALYNFLFAIKHNGTFIVRIEDTDQKRFVPGAEDYIKRSLEWCGIYAMESPWNPNPKYGNYRQSERDYNDQIMELTDKGFAYLAFDTEDEIKEKMPEGMNYGHKTRHLFKNTFTLTQDEEIRLLESGVPYVVRFKVPADTTVVVHDEIRGDISFSTENMDDKVLIKADGIPTYHFASVVDDHLMEISHVMRGDEWINSYAFHKLIYDAFEWKMPLFVHLPIILNPDGSGKLSKRTAARRGFEIFPLEVTTEDEKGIPVHFNGYEKLGYEPEGYINFLAQLGHTFSTDVMTMRQMATEFDFSKLHHNQAIFDTTKLEFLNKEHLHWRIKGITHQPYSNYSFWRELGLPMTLNGEGDQTYDLIGVGAILMEILPRVKHRKDIPIFAYPFIYHEKTADVSEKTKSILQNSKYKFTYYRNSHMINGSESFYTEDVKAWMDESGIDKKDLREVICSGRSGCDVATVISFIGKDEFLKRINKYL